jgi:hypothetical protein
MGAWKKAVAYVACSGLFVAGLPGFVLPVTAQQAAGAEQRESLAAKPLLAANDANSAKASELPDSPGATWSKSEVASNQQNHAGLPSAASPSSSQSAQSQSTPSQSAQSQSGAQAQPSPQKPVGTAVAEAPRASGIAASQPAGVAIAPAKQRRVRTIVLRMGALVGAGVAVGSVVALTAATSSKPPGAH